MSRQTNFPTNLSSFVDSNGMLTKEGRELLKTLWLTGPGAPQQLGWGGGTATASQGPLANYSGGTNTTNLANQVTLLTEVLATLITALITYGTLKN